VPVNLAVVGRAKIADREVVHEAVPAEDRMQAFLWRHLVPAEDLKALVFNPSYQPPPKRVRETPPPPPVEAKTPVAPPDKPPEKSKFTKQQVAQRVRQIKFLYEEGLITDAFHDRKMAECEALR